MRGLPGEWGRAVMMLYRPTCCAARMELIASHCAEDAIAAVRDADDLHGAKPAGTRDWAGRQGMDCATGSLFYAALRDLNR